jgi:hypothetical protein
VILAKAHRERILVVPDTLFRERGLRLRALRRLLPGSAAARRKQARVAVAGLAAALMLSRAVHDAMLSDEI